MATETHTKDLLPSVRALISFEEALVRYYETFAVWHVTHKEFWDSISLAKQTRANLYANLYDDIVKNPGTYVMGRGITGPALNMLNKINIEIRRIGTKDSHLQDHLNFMCSIETTILEQSALPSVSGNSTVFRKIHSILEKIQANQVRLISGLFRQIRAYSPV